nr:LysR family transcriptional regulator [Leucobacter edaphi]
MSLLREVAVHGGVTSAARALRMTPSNVSQQLRRLERDAGVALLEPRGRGVGLTPAAERLVRRAEDVLAILEEAESDLAAERSAGAGSVRLAGFHTFAAGLLGDVIARLHASAPGLELEFVQADPEEAFDEVLSRRADLAVIDEYDGHPLAPVPGLVRIPIGTEPIRALLPEGASDPATIDWAMEPAPSDAFRWARGVCRAAGFEPRVRFVSPDPNVHRSLLEQGVAAAFLPAIVADGLPSRIREVVDLPGPLRRTHALILRRGTERRPRIAACRAAITDALAAALGGPGSDAGAADAQRGAARIEAHDTV